MYWLFWLRRKAGIINLSQIYFTGQSLPPFFKHIDVYGRAILSIPLAGILLVRCCLTLGSLGCFLGFSMQMFTRVANPLLVMDMVHRSVVPSLFQWLCRVSHSHMNEVDWSQDRETNPRPLAYGNPASIKGTTTLTTKPNPLLQNRRFNDQGRT
jgi:hypothetical protein